MPFKLHVTSALGIPDIGIDYIQYPASHIIKLEAGNYAVVNTGIIISSCDTAGTILVTICDKYKDMIQISHNNFNPHQVHNNLPMVVHLYNSTDQFIRINTDEKIFKYQWSPIEPSTQVSAEVSAEVTEPTAEQPIEPSTQVSAEVIEPAAEQPIEPSTQVSAEVIEPATEPSTQESAEVSAEVIEPAAEQPIEETEQYTESEVSNDDENSTTNNKVSVDGEENTISFPTNNDENTAPINQTSTDGDENSIAMDNSVSVQPTVRRVRRLVKKRII
jgi:hypothetical protein